MSEQLKNTLSPAELDAFIAGWNYRTETFAGKRGNLRKFRDPIKKLAFSKGRESREKMGRYAFRPN